MAVTPVATYPNILKYGTKAAYVALQNKSADVLYFCTDSKEMSETVRGLSSLMYLQLRLLLHSYLRLSLVKALLHL